MLRLIRALNISFGLSHWIFHRGHNTGTMTHIDEALCVRAISSSSTTCLRAKRNTTAASICVHISVAFDGFLPREKRRERHGITHNLNIHKMKVSQFYRYADCRIISMKYIQRVSVEKLVIKQKRALRNTSRYHIDVYPIRALITQAFVKRNETINNTLNSQQRAVEMVFSEKITA